MKTYTVRVSIPGVAPFHFTAIAYHSVDVAMDAIKVHGIAASVTVRLA
jgi:hypothetical protein